ncbi:MAG: thiamine pyrophosphate-dependent dehydrogenase E1 component subunit alpha [Alphaproteobacteria bacterium]
MPSHLDPSTLSDYERLFYATLRIRRVEQRIIDIYPSDRIQSPVHLSIGQEAVAVGACDGLRRSDPAYVTYRSHAFYLAKGGDLNAMFAELYGRRDGMAKGKAGSMHLAAPDVGLMGASAIVASTIPHAVGSALAARNRRSGQVTLCVFGDGATEEGVYHESLNFAALHALPVLFLCENNELAVHAHRHERQAYGLVEHARSYGVGAVTISDGADFVMVRDVCRGIVDEMRRDARPRLVVVDTFRAHEHVGPGLDFDAGYRGRDGLCAWQGQDPLQQRADLVARFAPAIDAEIDAAVAFAENSPFPTAEDLLTDVDGLAA